jgi:hypothetical protein
MKKLRLNIDELRVEGFAAVDPSAMDEGTVLGNVATLVCTEKRSCGHICP